MEQEIHQPSPRLPEGWKQFQADNIDVTTISDLTTITHPSRHSRPPSALSNHSAYIIQPSQIQNNSHNFSTDSIYNSGENTAVQTSGDFDNSTPYGSGYTVQDTSPFHQPVQGDDNDTGEFEFHNHNSEMGDSNVTPNSNYFRYGDTAALNRTATPAAQAHSTLNQNSEHHHDSSNSNIDDYYLSSSGPSTPSPFVNPHPFSSSSNTSPPILQPFLPYPPDEQPPTQQQQTSSFNQPFDQLPTSSNNNTLQLGWTHHRTHSDQSDLSSNAASPYIGSVHSEHGSPYIPPQQDTAFDDELREAILGLEMGAPIDVSMYQNSHHNYDTSNLPLDQNGFPVDAPLFPSSSDRQEPYYEQQTSRPTSSSSYHHSHFPQSIFQAPPPSHISTASTYQSPPLPSATSIPEIEVTVAPPTPRSQVYNNFDYFTPQYDSRHPHQQRAGSSHNSPSIAPTYLVNNHDMSPLSLPPQGRRRAVSDSGTRPNMNPMMLPSNTNLVRRVSSGSHPYLGVHESSNSPSNSGRSTPNRISHHRKSFSHGSHHMTAREVLELVKNEGPREAKNPKKFVCDYPGCGQRFTRNSNKTTHMLTHKNERPHVCPHCQKDFTRQHDWKRHMELHDPSKKFKCAGHLADGRPWGCNKEFARKDALSRHFKSQQGRQCIEEVFREGRTLEDLYEQQGISLGQLSGNSSEGMYDD